MRLFSYITIITAALSLFIATPALAQEEEMVISSFVRDDCAHCIDQKEFFQELGQEYPNLEFKYYNLDQPEALALFNTVTTKYELVKGTPVTLVRNKLIAGFADAETTGALIKKVLAEETEPFTTFEEIQNGGAEPINEFSYSACETECVVEEASYIVTIPIIGTKVDVGAFSLTGLSLVLGFVDGFNPCAMWVLVMFLLILSQLGSRKKMFQYVGIFILAEAIMYYAILTLWLTAFDFISLNNIVTPLVGLLALGSGIYFLYKFYTFTPDCKVTNAEQKKKISQKIQSLAAQSMSVGVFLGILGVAFSVNIFEFACSIGIPQTFTKILELNGLSWWGTQWYMLLYILMYIIDDLVVFGIALYGLDKLSHVQGYTKWSTLVGGILMVLLGILMLTNPSLLVF
jgi:thiol-disulfide isomerase/thioredoxin